MNYNPIGVGLYSLAGVYGKKDLSELKKMLLYAVSKGVDYFDMADQYGYSEEFFSRTIGKYRPNIQIATKLGINDKGVMDCSYDNIQRACRKSLKRLNTDYIDVYQIHFDDFNTLVKETIESLEDLKKQGLIIKYGLCHLPFDRIKEYLENGSPETLMIEFSPIKINKYLEYIELFRGNNIKFISHGSTGRGILTGKLKKNIKFEEGDIRNIDPQFKRGLLSSALRVLDEIKQIAEIYNKTPVQTALNWIINKEGMYKALVGCSNIEHLKENLGAKEWNMNLEHIKRLDMFVKEENKKIKNIVMDDIKAILDEKEEKDIHIIPDLIYVLDGIAEYCKIDNDLFIPMFKRIQSLKKMKNNCKLEISNIKTELRSYIDN